MDSRISRGGINPYSHIWILTLKRNDAEGLQQKNGENPLIIHDKK